MNRSTDPVYTAIYTSTSDPILYYLALGTCFLFAVLYYFFPRMYEPLEEDAQFIQRSRLSRGILQSVTVEGQSIN